MCKCTPEIRTWPYCGKGDCVWPESKPENARESSDTIEHTVKEFLAALDHALFISKRTTPTHTWQEEYKAWAKVREARAKLESFL